MSAEHVGWAFRQKGLTPTRKLVLVALADRCNKDTLRCDPSVRKLSDDTGLSERTVERALLDLEEARLVVRVPRTRENGSATTNDYRFPDVTVSPPPRHPVTPPGVTVTPPEPELRTRKEPTLAAAPRERPRDEIWDALTTMFGEATTRTEQTNRGRVVRSLREAGATPADMFARAKRWPQHFDGATLTENAFERWYSTLDPKRKPLRRR